jgi:predicted nuclease of predicted toxin-antitoxin system
MRFLIDNSLSPHLADGLTAAGHHAIHVRAVGLAAAADTEVFARAAAEDRVLVAQDTDFAQLLAARRERKPSTILLRCRTRATAPLLQLLLANLPTIEEHLMEGAIVVIEDTRLRVRTLPIVPDLDARSEQD